MEKLELFRKYSAFLKDVAAAEEEELMLVLMAINMVQSRKRKKKSGGSRPGKSPYGNSIVIVRSFKLIIRTFINGLGVLHF